MNLFSQLRGLSRVRVYTDGAIRPERGISGLAAVVRDERGEIRHWWRRRAGRMTCNEAEYAAIIFALESLRPLHPAQVEVYSDSQVVVHQMRGLARAQAPALRQAQVRLRGLVVQFERVTFHHIPREQNLLADALANDVLDGMAGSDE
ncbi:MAG: ribonuclease HI family protein [Chloroflexi bacterium]|nr:ribonuclease HI family protein [Chloroflexota bacterium]